MSHMVYPYGLLGPMRALLDSIDLVGPLGRPCCLVLLPLGPTWTDEHHF